MRRISESVKIRFLILEAVIIIHLFFVVYIQNALSAVQFTPYTFFFSELMTIGLYIPYWCLLILGVGNIILFWLISKYLFEKQFIFIPVIIFAFIPWNLYLIAMGSFYIYLLFIVLLAFYGLLLLKLGKNKWGQVILVGVVGISIYSSLFFLLIIPMALFIFVGLKIIPMKKLKLLSIAIIILILPLFFLISKNKIGFLNILKNEIQVYSDPGLLNTVNLFRGEAKAEGLGIFSKISENKYLFYMDYSFLKFTKQLVPQTFFTQQEKLLNFSFSPPIYLGLLIPFLYGIYKILRYSLSRNYLYLSLLLVTPSFLARQAVDLNRLLIFSPVVIFIISYGLIKLYQQRKNKMVYLFIVYSVILMVFQIVFTLLDIKLREKSRYTLYYGDNIEIKRQ